LTRALAVAAFVIVTATGTARTQGLTMAPPTDSRPSLGGTGALRPPEQPRLLSGSQDAARKHKSPTGQPCLTVRGFARQQIINKTIFDHMITAMNACSELIKLQVCYYKSQHCVPVAVPSYGRKEVVLGIFPGMEDFRFEYREQF
jgi:hypothetical protein